jgi:hypothetical protein
MGALCLGYERKNILRTVMAVMVLAWTDARPVMAVVRNNGLWRARAFIGGDALTAMSMGRYGVPSVVRTVGTGPSESFCRACGQREWLQGGCCPKCGVD